MKKLIAIVIVLLALIGITSFKNNAEAAAVGAGPIGRNQVRVYPGPGRGQITVEWQRFFPDGENFSIHYGTGSGYYQFLADHVGYISTFTINNLTPGQRYYVAVEGIRAGNVSAGWDGQVSTVAPASSVTVLGTVGPIGRNSLKVVQSGKKGEVLLTWFRVNQDTEGYDVVYGTVPGQYKYGVLSAVNALGVVSNSFSFKVGALASGKRYYFAIVPHRGGTALYISPEVSIVAR